MDGKKLNSKHPKVEQVLELLRENARALGISNREMLGLVARRVNRGRRPKRVVKTRYRHPERPDLTWVGRGRRPGWVCQWLKSGGTLEQLEATGK